MTSVSEGFNEGFLRPVGRAGEGKVVLGNIAVIIHVFTFTIAVSGRWIITTL